MANWLGNSENIAQGWGPAPKLDAPSIGGLVSAILANRLARDKMSQEGIADTIRNVREERQSNEYLEAMKAAGLIPQDYEAGGLGGAKLGTGLATMIQRKNEFEAREAHRLAMEARRGGGGRGGGRGDEGVATQIETPEDYYGLSVKPGSPARETTREINGVVHVRTPKGDWKPGPKWMQNQGGSGETGKTGDISKNVKEALSLVEKKTWHDKKITAEEAQNRKDLKADVPYSKSDEYNLMVNRLKQLQEIPGMPSTAPAESGDALQTSRAPASDKAGGHADTYGVPPVGTERGGYRFKGGDPKDPNSWEPI